MLGTEEVMMSRKAPYTASNILNEFGIEIKALVIIKSNYLYLQNGKWLLLRTLLKWLSNGNFRNAGVVYLPMIKKYFSNPLISITEVSRQVHTYMYT